MVYYVNTALYRYKHTVRRFDCLLLEITKPWRELKLLKSARTGPLITCRRDPHVKDGEFESPEVREQDFRPCQNGPPSAKTRPHVSLLRALVDAQKNARFSAPHRLGRRNG